MVHSHLGFTDYYLFYFINIHTNSKLKTQNSKLKTQNKFKGFAHRYS